MRSFFFLYHRLPFNWKSFPIGYLAAVIIEMAIGIVQFSVIAFLMSFAFGAVIFFMAVSTDIRQELNALNMAWKENHDREELATSVRVIIKIHAAAKQLINLLHYKLRLISKSVDLAC